MGQRLQFPPEIDLEPLWHFEGGRCRPLGQCRPLEATQRLAEQLQEEALALSEPLTCWDLFPIRRKGRRRIMVGDGVALDGGIVSPGGAERELYQAARQ